MNQQFCFKKMQAFIRKINTKRGMKMKKLMSLYLLACSKAFCITTNVRDQQPTTLFNGLNKHIKSEIALPVALISITLVGIYFIVGKADAVEKLSNIAIGLAVIACGGAFAMWFF